jgi:hypothetical protein
MVLSAETLNEKRRAKQMRGDIWRAVSPEEFEFFVQMQPEPKSFLFYLSRAHHRDSI